MRIFLPLVFLILIILLFIAGCASKAASSGDPCTSSRRGGNVDRLCAEQGR